MTTLSRRQFAALLGITGAGISAAPWSLKRGYSQANGGAPVRFLAVRTPHGVDRNFWIPRKMSGDEPDTADEPLSSLTFDYDNAVLEPLMPWRDQITILDGLDTQVVKEGTRGGTRTAHGHQEQGTLLTGAQPPSDRSGFFDGHPSLDFYMHNRLSAPVLLTACVEGTGTWKCMSYDAAGRNRNPDQDPRSVFRSAFPADFMPPDPGDQVIDFSAGESRINAHAETLLKRIQGRLRGREAEKIVKHLQGMERLDPDMIDPVLKAACSTSGADQPSVDGNVRTYDRVEVITRAQANVIGSAFACGRSRCATLQILNDYPNYYTDVPAVRASGAVGRLGDNFRFHEDLVHGYWSANGNDDVLRDGYCQGLRWATGHFAAVLDELDKIIDPLDPEGGSILDNTVIFWHNEFGHDGHDRQETRHPAVIAGGGGKTLRLGRYLRLRDIDSNQRVPHNKLLVSICHAMGMTDVDFFGDRDLVNNPDYRGPLAPLMA